MDIDSNFRLEGIPAIPPRQLQLDPANSLLRAALLPAPLGLLAPLVGVWKGTGFNQIWRPFKLPTTDRFLELNLTMETLEFTEIPGQIPNRGLLQDDIALFGMTYLQQISDTNVKTADGKPVGIHIEPGIWINVPLTTDPADPATVARLANIPHGTTLLAQGTAQSFAGPPAFLVADITPFVINNPANLVRFPESNLALPSTFRSPPPDIVGITQAMVDNPNVVLAAGLAGKVITSTTILQISTVLQNPPVPTSGGGTSNIAFLDGAAGGPNAKAAQVDATFWISTFSDASGAHGQLLQYSQRVLLNFNGLSWPHISVANLVKQVAKPKEVKDTKDKPEIKDKAEIKDKHEAKEHKPEIKEHKPEMKEHIKIEAKEFETNVLGGGDSANANLAGRVAALESAVAAAGKPFIQPDERPAVGEAPLKKDPSPKPSR